MDSKGSPSWLEQLPGLSQGICRKAQNSFCWPEWVKGGGYYVTNK